jgi:hypothetical protein
MEMMTIDVAQLQALETEDETVGLVACVAYTCSRTCSQFTCIVMTCGQLSCSASCPGTCQVTYVVP